MQVFRFLVRYYGDAGEKAEAASVAYFGGRQALLVLRHNLPLCDPSVLTHVIPRFLLALLNTLSVVHS